MNSPSSSGSSPAAAVQDLSLHLQADPDSIPTDEPAPIEDLSETEGSFFPSPPAHYYKYYTTSNLALASTSTLPPIEGSVDVVGSDLEPPNVGWIVEDGSYSVFGERWPVVETLPGLKEMGVRELFSKEQDRSTSLLTLLRALLLSYSSLISSLLSPPPSLRSQPLSHQGESETPTDPERLVEHIRLISINMHHLVNELRPVQARESLGNMMRVQIDLRRAKTIAIQQKVAELQKILSGSRTKLSETSSTLEDVPLDLADDPGLVIALKELEEECMVVG